MTYKNIAADTGDYGEYSDGTTTSPGGSAPEFANVYVYAQAQVYGDTAVVVTVNEGYDYDWVGTGPSPQLTVTAATTGSLDIVHDDHYVGGQYHVTAFDEILLTSGPPVMTSNTTMENVGNPGDLHENFLTELDATASGNYATAYAQLTITP